MRKLYFLLIALFFALPLYSQVLKTQAVIIFANNDSIRAEIKNEQLHIIQTRIQYKPSGSSNFVTGLPDQVKSVKFDDGRLFESVKTDSVSFLLLCIIKGYYTLYKIEISGSVTYYIRHAGDSPIHLIETFTDRYIQSEGEYRKISNFEYVHQLISAMSDNAQITKEINETKFREDELLAIVKKYNEFKGNQYPVAAIANKKVIKISTGILVKEFPFITERLAPGIGVSFDFYRTRPYERFGLKTHISFNLKDYKKGDRYNLLMEIPIALSYSYFESGKIKLDLLGGASTFFVINSYTSYGHRSTLADVYPLLYLGTGIDYKVKKSALRFEISILTRSFILAYIF